jgi:hypothetical protein
MSNPYLKAKKLSEIAKKNKERDKKKKSLQARITATKLWQKPEYRKKQMDDRKKRKGVNNMPRKKMTANSKVLKERWNDPSQIYKLMVKKIGHKRALEVIERRLGFKARKDFEVRLEI